MPKTVRMKCAYCGKAIRRNVKWPFPLCKNHDERFDKAAGTWADPACWVCGEKLGPRNFFLPRTGPPLIVTGAGDIHWNCRELADQCYKEAERYDQPGLPGFRGHAVMGAIAARLRGA